MDTGIGRAARGMLGLVTKPLASALDALTLVGEGFLFMSYDGGRYSMCFIYHGYNVAFHM